MNAIIGYSCTREEWETLRLLLELPLPLGVSETPLEKEACQAAYDSLCGAGILDPVGDRVMVDRLYSFLLTELSESELCVMCRAQGRHVQLYRGAGLSLLCEWTAAQCTMTPFEDYASARESMKNAVSHCAAPMTLELLYENSVEESREYETPENALAGLDIFFQIFSDRIRTQETL